MVIGGLFVALCVLLVVYWWSISGLLEVVVFSTSGINGLLVVGVFLFFAHQRLNMAAQRIESTWAKRCAARSERRQLNREPLERPSQVPPHHPLPGLEPLERPRGPYPLSRFFSLRL